MNTVLIQYYWIIGYQLWLVFRQDWQYLQCKYPKKPLRKALQDTAAAAKIKFV